MAKPRFFTDEDVYGAIAPLLRNAGYDAVSAPEIGRLGDSDEAQLVWAADNARVLVTFNVKHFAARHAEWIAAARHHAGVIVSAQRPIGDMLRRLLRLAASKDDAELADQIVFLSDW